VKTPKQFTTAQAKDFSEKKKYKKMTNLEKVKFQLFQDKLCMPFSVFHEAIEKVLGRPVYTHEFAFSDNLKEEFLKKRPAPTLQEILELLPADKPTIIITHNEKTKIL